MANVKVQKLPTIRRLPTYLYKLSEMRKAGISIVATPELARYMNLGEIVIRKDLAVTGVTGQPGVGYKVKELIEAIKSYLNWDNASEAILVGAGSLGSALLGYEGFEEYGLKIIAAFDADPGKIGTEIHGRSVFGVERLEELVRRLQVRIGIICVPGRLRAGGGRRHGRRGNPGDLELRQREFKSSGRGRGAARSDRRRAGGPFRQNEPASRRSRTAGRQLKFRLKQE